MRRVLARCTPYRAPPMGSGIRCTVVEFEQVRLVATREVGTLVVLSPPDYVDVRWPDGDITRLSITELKALLADGTLEWVLKVP